MQINALGGPALKIISKTNLVSEGELVIVVNPYGRVKGLPKLRKQKSQIIIVSKTTPDYYEVKNHEKDAFVITSPGEYEIKGALFGTALP